MKKFAIVIATALLTFLLVSCDRAEAARAQWTQSTYRIHSGMVALGFEPELATYVIDKCKAEADDPKHCVVTATFVAQAESGCGQSAKNHNVWGIQPGTKYASAEENFDRWMRSYLKYWYGTNGPHHFYSPRGKYPKTRYCTSEHSSGSRVGCPNGLKNSQKAFSFITEFAYNPNHE